MASLFPHRFAYCSPHVFPLQTGKSSLTIEDRSLLCKASIKELGSSFQQASEIMSGTSTDEDVSTLKFNTGLRGYHVYRTSWKPFLKQQFTFKQEKDNKHDRFAVAGKQYCQEPHSCYCRTYSNRIEPIYLARTAERS